MNEVKSIAESEKEIIEDFSLFDSWDEKYEYIIELGKKLPLLNPVYRTDDHIVKGCQSTVWLGSSFRDGKVFYEADSDAIIVKGLISLLIRILSGHRPDEIIQAQLECIKVIGMASHLAQTRANGLLAMVKQMKNDALAYQLQNQLNQAE
ncbi:MAG: SufE family protein [Bacteroidetes bacterium]|nr:SufE family protein [Bacteroidota bacterium]